MRTRLNPFTDAEQCRWPYPQFSLDRPIAPAETVAAAAGGYESP
jgi:hypothetical protein